MSAVVAALEFHAQEDGVDPAVRLPLDHVVSRYRDGAIASRLGDLIWDWRPYTPSSRRSTLSFNYWDRRPATRAVAVETLSPERKRMVADMQHVMSLILYKRPGPTLSYLSLSNFLAHLRDIAARCESRGLRLDEFFGDEREILSYASSDPSARYAAYSWLISLLLSLDPVSDVGFHVAGARVLSQLRGRTTELMNALKQTPPIPTRIYSQIITRLDEELRRFEAVADPFFTMIRECRERRRKCRPGSTKWMNIAREVIERTPELDRYFEEENLAKDPSTTSRRLKEIQFVCKLIAHAFTGMRNEEATSLPFFCLEQEEGSGRTHYILCGQTTKLNNGKIRRTKWVTTAAGYHAAEVARRIAQFVYSEIGVVPIESDDLLTKFPLFVNIAHLGFGHPKRDVDDHVIATSDLSASTKGLAGMRAKLLPAITSADIAELESIDPHRAWRSEPEFQVGAPWPLATHQLRRSLALYAQRSGLVSLPSLKRQLQHITVEMSRYYAKGAAFAINFVDDDPDTYKMHVAHDWRVAKPESEALAFLRDVVFSEEELFGGAGSFEQGKKDRCEFVDREVTIARFRRGEVAYRETPLGGCTKIGQCDQVGLKIVDTACLRGCQNMIGKMSRLDGVIRRQESLVSALAPDTVEFRMEHSDLKALRAAREQWEASSTRRQNVQRTR